MSTPFLSVAAGGPQSPDGAAHATAKLLAIEERRAVIYRQANRIDRQVRRARSILSTSWWMYAVLAAVSAGFAVWAFTVSTAAVQTLAVIAVVIAVQQPATALYLIVSWPRWTARVGARLDESTAKLEQCRVDAERVARER